MSEGLFLEAKTDVRPRRTIPRNLIRQTPKAGKEHVYEGFPHYTNNRRRLGYCMCLQECCQGVGGCICKTCACKGKGHEHETKENNPAAV